MIHGITTRSIVYVEDLYFKQLMIMKTCFTLYILLVDGGTPVSCVSNIATCIRSRCRYLRLVENKIETLCCSQLCAGLNNYDKDYEY